jgi:two-component system nitrate/nitrite response regulator NarL
VVAAIEQPESASFAMPLLTGVAIVSGLDDSEDVASVVTRVREHLPSCRIILVGEKEDPSHLLRVLEAGVRGYVPARESPEQLVEATQTVAQGKVAIPRHLYEPLVQYLLESRLAQYERRALLDRLTRRELEVLQLLVEGGSNESIAQDLAVTVDTARTHVQRILRKLGVHSRIAAAAIAMNYG